MIWFHLHDAEDNWVGQFRSVEAIESYMVANELNINDFTIKPGLSKYPA
jgi:hypothetical protein